MNFVRGLRESAGMTQQEFAADIGVSISTVVKWEAGGNPSRMAREKLEKFAERIGRK